MNELHLFAGAGGGILAGQLLGHTTVCAVEWEPYAQAVLVARQNDGTFPPFPIWDDVQTFDGKPWRGIVDIVAGGFPCQDISVAGKGEGLDGKRSGMWAEMARIIGEVRPRYAYIENSPALVSRGLDRVLADLAALGMDARWGVLSAASVGASHLRERTWILASARSGRCREQGCREVEQPWRAEAVGAGDVPDATGEQPHGRGAWAKQDGSAESANVCSDVPNPHGLQQLQPQGIEPNERGRACNCSQSARSLPAWPADPADAPQSGLGRVAHGVAHRSHRIKAIGNGQVSRVAATAFELLRAM